MARVNEIEYVSVEVDIVSPGLSMGKSFLYPEESWHLYDAVQGKIIAQVIF